MDNVEMGGGWYKDQIGYMQLDIYLCKNGINYNESDINCSSYEDIIKAAGEDNSFEFEVFYPVVHYQPKNKTKPIFVRYDSYFYHFSRYTNKIDRLYLQEHILTDDNGWFVKDEKNYSFWGHVSLAGDSYFSGKEKDIMNEGSSSRLYSFNIYLKYDVVYYNKYYKKIFLVIADGISIVFGIFSFFRKIALIIKLASENKKLTELLFESAPNQPRNDEEKLHHIKTIQNNNKLNFNYTLDFNKKYNNDNLINYSNNDDHYNNNNNNNDSRKNNNMTFPKENNLNDISSLGFFNLNNKGHSKRFSMPHVFLTNNNNITNINNYYNNDNIGNNNVSIYHDQNKNSWQNQNDIKDNNEKNCKSEKISRKPTLISKKVIFPFNYYLYTIFIKGFDVSKKSIFFNETFIIVYNFICQLFDISTYLLMKKEFEILKMNFLQDKYRVLLEKKKKINLSDKRFNIYMNNCLDNKNFDILGRVNSRKIN